VFPWGNEKSHAPSPLLRAGEVRSDRELVGYDWSEVYGLEYLFARPGNYEVSVTVNCREFGTIPAGKLLVVVKAPSEERQRELKDLLEVELYRYVFDVDSPLYDVKSLEDAERQVEDALVFLHRHSLSPYAEELRWVAVVALRSLSVRHKAKNAERAEMYQRMYKAQLVEYVGEGGRYLDEAKATLEQLERDEASKPAPPPTPSSVE
jgi:hypothetical protein